MSGINAGISPVAVPVSASWSTTWTMSGNLDLGTFTMTGPLALTSSATGAVPGGMTCAVIIADGTNVPTVDGLTVSPFDTTAGAKTLLCLTRVGAQNLWFGSLPVSAPAPAPAPASPANLRLFTKANATESGDGTAGWAYSMAATGSWNAAASSHPLAATGDFTFQAVFADVGSPMIGWQSNTTGPGAFTDAGNYNIFSSSGIGSAYLTIQNGSLVTPGVTVNRAAGDVLRVQRTGTTVVMQVARTATPTTFTTVATITGISGNRYAFVSADVGTTFAISQTKGLGFA